MKSAYDAQSSETKAWKDSIQRVQTANAEAQRAGKKRRQAHEAQIAKMHAGVGAKGTSAEVYR